MKRSTEGILHGIFKIHVLKVCLRYTKGIFRHVQGQLYGILEVTSSYIEWYAGGILNGVLKVY